MYSIREIISAGREERSVKFVRFVRFAYAFTCGEIIYQNFLSAVTTAGNRIITQSSEIFNHCDAFSFSFSDRASAIIIYYVVKRVVEQRDGATRNKLFVVSSVLIAAGEKGGERQASRSAYHRYCVYHAKPLPTRSPHINA